MPANVTVYDQFTEQQRVWLGAACIRTAKMLEELAKRATEANKPRDAARFQEEAEAVRTDLLARTVQAPLHASAADRRALECGLRSIARNYRAAAGTVLALGEAKLADEFKTKAEKIEEDLVPEFGDQLDMKLLAKEGAREGGDA